MATKGKSEGGAASAPTGNTNENTSTEPAASTGGQTVEGAEGQGQAAPPVPQVEANTPAHHDAGTRPDGWGGGAPDLATAEATGAPLAASAAADAGSDTVTGSEGADSLSGGQGDDTQAGGASNLGDWDGDGKPGGDAGALSAEDLAMIQAAQGPQDEDEPQYNGSAQRAAAGLPEPDANGNLPRMEAVPQTAQPVYEVQAFSGDVVEAREPTLQDLLANSMAIDAEVRANKLGAGGPNASAVVTLPTQTTMSEPRVEGEAHPNEKVNDAIGSIQDIAGNYVQGNADTVRGPGNPVFVGTALVNEPVIGAPALIPVENQQGWGTSQEPQT